jgi:hypothetical protein
MMRGAKEPSRFDSCFLKGTHIVFYGRLKCQDCYIYAGAGVGFEFQTEQFDVVPTYLVYMKLWVGAEAAYSINLNLDTPGAFGDFEQIQNMLLNDPGGNNIDFRSKSYQPDTPKILRSDLIINVAGITININFHIPVFLQWQVQTAGGGTAYAGSYFKARVVQGLVYMNPYRAGECDMPGCVRSCSGWCTVDERSIKQGGSGPVWTFTDNVKLRLYLTPIFIINVWSSTVLGFFQARISSNLNQSFSAMHFTLFSSRGF